MKLDFDRLIKFCEKNMFTLTLIIMLSMILLLLFLNNITKSTYILEKYEFDDYNERKKKKNKQMRDAKIDYEIEKSQRRVKNRSGQSSPLSDMMGGDKKKKDRDSSEKLNDKIKNTM